jgi:hypothetical protein
MLGSVRTHAGLVRWSAWGCPPALFSLTAVPIFKYMGDYPSRQAWSTLELTDQIFSLALQDASLQDEVYCQILKQLTHNSNRSARNGRVKAQEEGLSYGLLC